MCALFKNCSRDSVRHRLNGALSRVTLRLVLALVIAGVWCSRQVPSGNSINIASAIRESQNESERVDPVIAAKWIWNRQENYNPYQQTILAKKEFHTPEVNRAKLRIACDGRYRLFINDRWVNDGPCRSWPEHFQYDQIDVAPLLTPGKNELRILARHWSVGTFHAVPRQAGLLVQIDLEHSNGATEQIISDQSWLIAECPAWRPNTPKVSIQMEPQELYDARLESNSDFSPAAELYEAEAGPWQDLNPRDVALLTKTPFAFRSFVAANVVKRSHDLDFCIPAQRLLNGPAIEANHSVSSACGVATVLKLDEPGSVTFSCQEGFFVRVDGNASPDDRFDLAPGKHLVLAFSKSIVGHRKDLSIRIVDPPQSLTLINPLYPDYENPWTWIPFQDYAFVNDDLDWQAVFKGKYAEMLQRFRSETEQLFSEIADQKSFVEKLGKRSVNMPSQAMFFVDSYWQFASREALAGEQARVENPAGLMSNNAESTVLHPSPAGDVELVYDLGQQNIGYYDFELTTEAGVIIDIFGVEYITADGAIQHTQHNRNGMRYIAKQGRNAFTSLKRRSGRYIFITFRNVHAPVVIHNFQIIESTYPVNQIGRFRCSDTRLERIWEMSALTLKLCMEDTFTDCPLYEQTLWVGDARNEALFAYPVFGATDIAKRCITLAGRSLERFPIVGCQVPSSWEVLLPAWSYLWGISVWDYYFYSADLDFLKSAWPMVIQNLRGAEAMRNERGLFTAPLWNMFDWSGIDDQHVTVLHNSMLLVGAIDAALKCTDALDDSAHRGWLTSFRGELIAGIGSLWDNDKKAYRDALDESGQVSQSTSQHTSFLSLLYNIVPAEHRQSVIDNIVSPPATMIPVGSPFAMLYYYEALEAIGMPDAIIRSIYESYLPMLEAGATTVWEIFASSNYRPGAFPTRSHCHAWSSAPLYFLNRIILGIKPVQPGGTEIEVSPRLNGLSWAEGAIATPRGTLSVSWRLDGNELHVKISAPRNVNVICRENETHRGLNVHWDF
ncbi:MAG: alpha-L-rhamnosidase C-terminal domain-containing protein [Candidatus Zhuqueibacterota bacterium]